MIHVTLIIYFPKWQFLPYLMMIRKIFPQTLSKTLGSSCNCESTSTVEHVLFYCLLSVKARNESERVSDILHLMDSPVYPESQIKLLKNVTETVIFYLLKFWNCIRFFLVNYQNNYNVLDVGQVNMVFINWVTKEYGKCLENR
jgi:hypothetical protein